MERSSDWGSRGSIMALLVATGEEILCEEQARKPSVDVTFRSREIG